MKSQPGTRVSLPRAGPPACGALLALLFAAGSSADGGADRAAAEMRSFRITGIALAYARAHPALPSIEELRRLELKLGAEGGRLVAPGSGVARRSLRLDAVSDAAPVVLSGAALRSINEQLVEALSRRGLRGVLVMPHEGDVDPGDGRDLRPPGRTRLRLVIRIARIRELHTWSWGPASGQEGRADHPLHERIASRSPVQPGDPARQDAIDAYVARLNRHPGRRADSVISAGDEAGEVDLHYRIVEARPLRAWVGGSNSGTSTTAGWRQRFGVLHSQLTHRDDLLRLDYVTGSFDELNAVFGSYEAPVPPAERWRLGVRGSWSEYDAPELGRAVAGFDGEQWDAGAELALELFQRRDWFVDLFAGAAWRQVKVIEHPPRPPDPMPVPRIGESGFFLPELGVRVERVDPESRVRAGLSGLFNVPEIAGTQSRDLLGLGRPGVYDTSFGILHWKLMASFFLEPLLAAGRAEAPAPPSSGPAHEIWVQTDGQHSLGKPLVPQFQGIVGGAATVRGYDQSIVAGDTVVLGRAEYRFHLPWVLGPRPSSLLLRAFVDAGRSRVESRLAGERDETLVGAGPGVELQLLEHLVLRLDLGVALSEVRGGALARVGDRFLHFSGSLVY